jgi:hypothetical protein
MKVYGDSSYKNRISHGRHVIVHVSRKINRIGINVFCQISYAYGVVLEVLTAIKIQVWNFDLLGCDAV